MSDRSGRLAPLITAMSLASAEPAVRPASPPVAGERDAVWAALYDRHFDDVYRLVRRAGVSVADAETWPRRCSCGSTRYWPTPPR